MTKDEGKFKLDYKDKFYFQKMETQVSDLLFQLTQLEN